MNENKNFDIIIIGGGVTGAGIFYQSVYSGYKTLLLEARDFSFGTSSRTGKLVHGGFRYLLNKQFSVSYHSVKERERLISKSQGLVDRVPFIYLMMDSSQKKYIEKYSAMFMYRLFSNKIGFRSISPGEIQKIFRRFGSKSERGGFAFSEGTTDDSRLTLRLIFDSINMGGVAKNYSKVVKLLKNSKGVISGVAVAENSFNGKKKNITNEFQSKVVINATGMWLDDLCEDVNYIRRIRRQRGSHLILPSEKLSLDHAVMFNHPIDNRIQFALPWNGTIVFGTTDLDENDQIDYLVEEPGITQREVDYLLVSLNHVFPEAQISESDIISTFCGIRPIIKNNSSHPSSSSRRHQIWDDNGMVSIAGGKLTTFQLMAYDALIKSGKYLNQKIQPAAKHSFLNQQFGGQQNSNIDAESQKILSGRYGQKAFELITDSDGSDLIQIERSPYYWAELKWSAKNEKVVHLDDLLLRRTKLGLLLEKGGLPIMKEIISHTNNELGWSDKKWQLEIIRYQDIWKNYYSLPK